MCSDIVDAISLIPLPYSTDYPFFTSLRLQSEQVNGLSALPYWNITEVTTNLQADHSVFARVYEPTSDSLPHLWEIFGSDIEPGHIFKVRVYGRPFITTPSSPSRSSVLGAESGYWCCVNPIVCYKPLTKRQVDKLCERVFDNCGDDGRLLRSYFLTDQNGGDCVDDRYKAKLRLLHYMAAHKLGHYWIDTLDLLTSEPVIRVPDEQSIRYVFPEPAVNLVIRCTDIPGTSLLPSIETQRLSGSLVEQPQLPLQISKYNGSDAWSVDERLIEMFVRLYQLVELPAREIVLRYGKIVFDPGAIRSTYTKHIHRLDRGYSLMDLRSGLSGLGWENDKIYQVISNFLDRMIDRGIVVPITCVTKNCVFRGYRHGEDVKFGEGERVMLHSMLSAYIEELGSKSIAGIEIEKLSVVTIKKMLEAKYLIRSDKTTLGQRNTIGVRFSLHGAVLAEGGDSLMEAASESCIRSILKDAGIVCPVGIDDQSEHTSFNVSPFDTENGAEVSVRDGALEEADTLGSLLGYLRARGAIRKSQDRLTQQELILLATVSEARDLCGALGAEVKFVDRGFKRFAERYSRALDTREAASQIFPSLRDVRNNYLFVALHSATWKYRSWLRNKPEKIIDRITAGLRASGMRLHANKWSQLWPATQRESTDTMPTSLKELIQEITDFLHCFSLYYCTYQLAIATIASDVQGRIAGAGTLIKEWEYSYQYLADRGIPLYSQFSMDTCAQMMASVDISRDYGRRSLNIMASQLNNVEDLLTSVDLVASPYGQKRSILNFENILVIKFPHVYKRELLKASLIKAIQPLIKNHISKSPFQETSVRILPGDTHDFNDCVIIAGYKSQELFFLRQVIEKVSSNSAFDGSVTYLFADLRQSNRLHCEQTTNKYFGSSCWSTVRNTILAIDEQFREPYYCDLYVVSDESIKPIVGSRDFSDYFKWTHTSASNDTILTLDQSLGFEERVRAYNKTWSYSNMEETAVDIGIISVVSDEYVAVKDHLKRFAGYRDDVISPETVIRFCVGTLPAMGGKFHTVAAVRAVKQGNTAIMPIYQEMRSVYQPKLIVLLGIGGNINEDLDVGDVMIADQILDYDTRASTPTGQQRTGNPLPILAPWLKYHLTRFEEQYGERKILKSLAGFSRDNFKVAFGPIGSGAAVVKDNNDSDIKQWLRTVSRKVLGVDTEALGVADGVYHDQLRHKNRTDGYLVIRGISDNADSKKSDHYRREATANAMVALQAIVELASPGFEDEIPKEIERLVD